MEKVISFTCICQIYSIDWITMLSIFVEIWRYDVRLNIYQWKFKFGKSECTKNNAKIPSLAPVYRSAELQEREAFDTFGIIYEGHPDPRRLFMWEEFRGHPLRKDYEQEDTEILEVLFTMYAEQSKK